MNFKHGKASILAIGTELTTGQITNRNAAWISEKLSLLGVEVLVHLAVPDDHSLIFQALEECAAKTQFIFVTGGLGPTTDDFTRDVVAKWLNQPLFFHEESWNHIVRRLKEFNVTVAESNRRQCYFPENSKILFNPQGTASGFTSQLSAGKQQVWIFPGPPNELNAIWNESQNQIEEQIRLAAPECQPMKLITWQCMGKSEAELGEITERALEGSGLTTGYRAHRPFVEVKVWCLPHLLSEKHRWIQNLENAIRPWIITRQGEDLMLRLLHQLQRNDSIEVIDSASHGILSQRFQTALRTPQFKEVGSTITLVTEWSHAPLPIENITYALEQSDEESLTLILSGFSPEGESAVGLREGHRSFTQVIPSPYGASQNAQVRERLRPYAVEMAIKYWCEWLDTATN